MAKVRFIVDESAEAERILDEKSIAYDYDSGDRLMVDEEDAEEAALALESEGIDFDEV